MTTPIRVGLIGAGGMARYHIRQLLKMQSTTRIIALCEPSEAMALEAAKVFVDAGLPPPPNQPEWQKFIAEYGAELDAVIIITPHALHHDQTRACLEAGIDVLLEKPMVMTAAEAHSLIETRDRTGRLLVVAFQGSLSPQVRLASRLLRAHEFGQILTISGIVWQNWGPNTVNTWRQEPALSGGGFLFDTGAHLLNTVADLAGEDFSEVAAWFVHNGRPVETIAVAMGRLKSGGLVTFHACGETIPSCASEIRVFCEKGILHTGIWGGNAGSPIYGRPASGSHSCAAVAGGMGAVSGGAGRSHPQPVAARSGTAHGKALGCDPGERRKQWNSNQL